MNATKVLVCSDRDGTILKDENYYLGKSPEWKKQVEFLPGVVEGIKLLNTLPNLEFFIVTNQAGVAISHDPSDTEFANLTEKRMNEVNQYVLEQLAMQGAKVSGHFSCPYVDFAYLEKAESKGRLLDHHYVRDNHPDLKPNPGMVLDAVKELGGELKDYSIWVIGDRATDVKMGLNVPDGKGILIASFKTKELGDYAKVQKLKESKPNNVFIEQGFLNAAQKIHDYS